MQQPCVYLGGMGAAIGGIALLNRSSHKLRGGAVYAQMVQEIYDPGVRHTIVVQSDRKVEQKEQESGED